MWIDAEHFRQITVHTSGEGEKPVFPDSQAESWPKEILISAPASFGQTRKVAEVCEDRSSDFLLPCHLVYVCDNEKLCEVVLILVGREPYKFFVLVFCLAQEILLLLNVERRGHVCSLKSLVKNNRIDWRS